jgi:hypothetical protein
MFAGAENAVFRKSIDVVGFVMMMFLMVVLPSLMVLKKALTLSVMLVVGHFFLLKQKKLAMNMVCHANTVSTKPQKNKKKASVCASRRLLRLNVNAFKIIQMI